MATVRDVILIGALIFAFGVGFFILHFVGSTLVSRLSSISQINQSSHAITAFQGINTVVNRLDYVIFGIFIGLVLGVIITGWFIGGNPIFMFIYFLVLAIGVAFSTILANVWETLTTVSAFGTTINSFPITNNLLLNLPIYLAVIGFIGMVVMFAKPYFQQNLGQGGY